MLIINADDWGGWTSATDAIHAGHVSGLITAATAMVFMKDSERAADMALGSDLDVGLHLNFAEAFTGSGCPEPTRRSQQRIVDFLGSTRYAVMVYHPRLRRAFQDVMEAQFEEFRRLYHREPSHVDGHRHMHLCANVVWADLLPQGAWVRRNFTYFRGEKGAANRMYRRTIDRRLRRRCRTTDYFFSLSECLHNNRLERVARLARTSTVELMTHPEWPNEHEYLTSEAHARLMRSVPLTTYADLASTESLREEPTSRPS